MPFGASDLMLHVTTTGAPVGRFTSIGARREVRRLLAGRMSAPDLDAVLLATSELVNNALVHAAPAVGTGACEVTVWLADADVVRVEVADAGDHVVELPPPPPAAQLFGRGLNIVDTIVDRWGAERTAGAGKVVWFELDLGRAGHTGWTVGAHGV